MRLVFKFFVLMFCWIVIFVATSNILFDLLVMHDGSYTSTDADKWRGVGTLISWIVATVFTFMISQCFEEKK